MGTLKRSVFGVMRFTLAFFCATVSVRSDEIPLKEKVLREYPKAVISLENHYSSAKGVVRRSLERHGSANNGISINGLYTFECNGTGMARVVSDAQTEIVSAQKKSSRHRETVMCYNRDYSFQLRREDPKNAFSIISFESNVGGKSLMEHREMGQWLFIYLDAPFSIYTFRLSTLFADERLSLRDVFPVSDGGKQKLKIEFERMADSHQRGWMEGWLVVSPDEAWVVSSYEFKDKNKMFARGTIEYGGVEGGFPLPKRVIHMKGNLGKEMPSQVLTFDFDEINFGKCPDNDFTLAAFGLPELARSSRNLAASPAPWLLGLSVIAIVIALVLKVISSRFRDGALASP